MEKPAFQFGLKAVFVVMSDAAILLALTHYVPAPFLVFLGILFLLLIFVVTGFCWLIGGR